MTGKAMRAARREDSKLASTTPRKPLILNWRFATQPFCYAACDGVLFFIGDMGIVIADTSGLGGSGGIDLGWLGGSAGIDLGWLAGLASSGKIGLKFRGRNVVALHPMSCERSTFRSGALLSRTPHDLHQLWKPS